MSHLPHFATMTDEQAAFHLAHWTDVKASVKNLEQRNPQETMSETTRRLLDMRGYSFLGWVSNWLFPSRSGISMVWTVGVITGSAIINPLLAFGFIVIAAVAWAHRWDVRRAVREDLTHLGYDVDFVDVLRRSPGWRNYVVATVKTKYVAVDIWASEEGFHSFDHSE